jgi:hypothetical protein
MDENQLIAKDVEQIKNVEYQMEVISKLPFEVFNLLPVGLKCAYFKSEGKVTVNLDEMYGMRPEDVGSNEVVLDFSIKVPLGLLNKCGEKPDASTFAPIVKQYLITVLKLLIIQKDMKNEKQAKIHCYQKIRKHFELLFSSSIFSSAVDYFWRGPKV